MRLFQFLQFPFHRALSRMEPMLQGGVHVCLYTLQVFKRFPQGYSAQTEHHCVPATAVQQRDAAAGFSSAARPRPPTFASLKDSIEKARRRNPKGYDEAAVSQAKNQAGIEGPAARLLVEKQATTKTTDPQAVSPDLIASAALRRVALTTLPKAVQESMYDFLRGTEYLPLCSLLGVCACSLAVAQYCSTMFLNVSA